MSGLEQQALRLMMQEHARELSALREEVSKLKAQQRRAEVRRIELSGGRKIRVSRPRWPR